MSKIKLLLLAIDLILIHTVDSSNVHYITPSPDTQCPAGESCLTLPTLAANSRRYFHSNTTVFFLEGSHTLDSELIVSNINGPLVLLTNGSATASISCSGRLEFFQITQLHISGLEFFNCSFKIELVDQFSLEDSRFFGRKSNSALNLNRTYTNIVRSSFVSNTAGTKLNIILPYVRIYQDCPNLQSTSTTVGGALIVTSSTVIISNSYFENNTARVGGAIFSQKGSIISIRNSTFVNNSAAGCKDEGCQGGALFIDSGCSATVHSSSFINNTAGYGGAIALSQGILYDSADNVFSGNRAAGPGGAISVYSRSRITMYNSHYSNNSGRYGGAVYMHKDSSIIVSHSMFDKNRAQVGGGVMYASSSSSITIDSSFFHKNEAGSVGGVMYAPSSSGITIGGSSFHKNEAGSGGGVMYVYDSYITVSNSSFDNNEAAVIGGVICVHAYSLSSITVSNSSFVNNEAGDGGGVMYAPNSIIFVLNSSFDSNVAGNNGGVMFAYNSIIIEVTNSCFLNNVASNNGGVLYAHYRSSVTIRRSSFDNNRAGYDGGVMYVSFSSSITVDNSFFGNNEAGDDGGVVFTQYSSSVTVDNSFFDNNVARRYGGVILAYSSSITVGSSSFDNNEAGNDIDGGVMSVDYSSFKLKETVGNNCIFIRNQGYCGGVVCASESKINVYCQIMLMANNTAIDIGGSMYLYRTNISFLSKHSTIVSNEAKAGGAIFSRESQLTFASGSGKLVGNKADDGGAIYARESKLIVEENSRMNLSTNLVLHNGGGLYLIMSELNTKGYNLYFNENQANGNGGGIHADNSSITIEGEIHLINNVAENGGAISLERYTKLLGKSGNNDTINLMSNTARHHGGALYVKDEINPEMCAPVDSSNTECFSRSVLFSFLDNSAGISGTNLFGGLLDRCIMHAKFHQESKSGLKRAELGLDVFQNSSNIDESQLDTITSDPVQLCFCQDDRPDCSYQPEPIQVNRRKAFSLKLAAFNHILRPIRADVDINSTASGKIAGQNIDKVCTEIVLQFNLSTQVESANLTLSVIGPCDVPGISVKNAIIQFTCTCPIGFQVLVTNNKSCDCICHRVIQPYPKTECNPTIESIIRRENFWISYINHNWSNSSGYVVYPHCPFDYCYTYDKSVSINLNLPDGSDAQCNLNRMGTLCGTCKPNRSVSLGSSKCIFCPTYWPGLLATITTVFIISGIGLVAIILLALNLTVAIGTLNAIIFYANAVTANKSAFFPSGVSPASVFISWLNFDLGFDACFFDGMDTYVKTWLQLAFPAYIIVLVVMIIQLSYYFNAFGRLIGKKDPVATLATLILLSYIKFLQTIITAFSSATLAYPDGSKKTVWLPDASLEYFSSKHAVLFFVAILILLAGLISLSCFSHGNGCFNVREIK